MKVITLTNFTQSRIFTVSFAVMSLAALLLFHRLSEITGPLIYYNSTPSMPLGLYFVRRPVTALKKGMVVLFRLPDGLNSFAAGTSWLKPGEVLIKYVGALPGDLVCVGEELSIDGEAFGRISSDDGAGVALPRQRGCFVVPEGYFLPVGKT